MIIHREQLEALEVSARVNYHHQLLEYYRLRISEYAASYEDSALLTLIAKFDQKARNL